MATPAQFMVLAGGSGFSPASLGSTLRGWYKSSLMVADGNAAADADLVSVWTDHGTTAQNFTAATTARPTYKTNIINGLPVVRFNGTANILKTATFTALALPFSVMFTVKWLGAAGGADAKLFGTDTVKRAEISKKITSDFWALFQSDVGAERVSTVAVNASWHVVLGRWATDATGGLFVDGGAAVASGAMAAAATMVQRTLGGYPGDSNFAQIDTTELIVMGAASVAQENQIGAYLAASVGTTWANVS